MCDHPLGGEANISGRSRRPVRCRVARDGALCSKEVPADGLKVYAPGETRAEPIPFSFGACAHRGVLIVGPVKGGVGVPGYTTS